MDLLSLSGICQGDWTLNAVWKYVSGEEVFRSINNPVHGFTVTPVLSFPQERVMVFVFKGLDIFCLNGCSALSPTPALKPAQTIIS